jgi:heme-degrading monooxygenase HmoA
MNILPAAGRQEVVAINVFPVAPGHQQELIDCIQRAGSPESVPGLLAMHLLRSADGTRVINHMYWENEAAFRAAVASDPVIAATRDQVSALLDGGRPERFEVLPWP